MNQIFEPYWKWEDFQHGMYDAPKPADIDGLVAAAAGILSCPQAFRLAASRMVEAWPVAAAVNLTNISTNRRAWIGQATCSHAAGVPEIVTRSAWKDLTDDQRCKANEVADEVIREYERKSRAVHQGVGGPRLFGWDT
jgi:hypothetical protein